jgi:putative ATP-dependent endonuclease of the OLD family
MTGHIEIKQFHIKHFRGISDLKWNPKPGMNMIIGGGDCGKTTALEALGFLFHPGNNISLSEADFLNRESQEGFSIEAVISISEEFDFTSGSKVFWPWEWNGEDPTLPIAEADVVPEMQCPVFRVSVTATAEFELSWDIIQPDGSREYFPTVIRRRIGLVNLSGDDKNDRDLRLVYGSALDRLLSDENLRSKFTQVISQLPLTDQLSEQAKMALNALDQSLDVEHLPSGLSLGFTGSQGISIGALIGLLAQKNGVSLPLSSWGAGTRRMSSLQISAAKTTDARITTVDEIERGLEPYRLRQLIDTLQSSDSQSFVTTHSPVAISCATEAQLWYLDAAGSLGKLDQAKINSQQKRDPETFLSKVAVVVEGETELGFVSIILEKLFNGTPLSAGTRVCLGQGDAQLLGLLEELSKSGIRFCGFADSDGEKTGHWDQLKQEMGDRLFRWPDGCIETNVLNLLPDEYMELLFKDSDGDWNGNRLRTIAERLGIDDKSFEAISIELEQRSESLLNLIIAASTGSCADLSETDKSTRKSWKKHARNWFKKGDGSGGRELLEHLYTSNKWDDLEPVLRPFFNAVLMLSGKSEIQKIDL